MGEIVIGIHKPSQTIRITRPADAAKLLSGLRTFRDEVYACIYLTSDLEVTGHGLIAYGSLTRVVTDCRNIFRFAFLDDYTKYLIVAHNHPGQRWPTPSEEDGYRMKEVRIAGNYLSLPVLDALIIGMESYYSYVEHGDIWSKANAYIRSNGEEAEAGRKDHHLHPDEARAGSMWASKAQHHDKIAAARKAKREMEARS